MVFSIEHIRAAAILSFRFPSISPYYAKPSVVSARLIQLNDGTRMSRTRKEIYGDNIETASMPAGLHRPTQPCKGGGRGEGGGFQFKLKTQMRHYAVIVSSKLLILAKRAVVDIFLSSEGNNATGDGVQAGVQADGVTAAAPRVPLAQLQPTPVRDGVAAEPDTTTRSVSMGTAATEASLAQLQPTLAQDGVVAEPDVTARSVSVGAAYSNWGA